MIPGIDLSSNNGPVDWLATAPWLLTQHPEAFVAVKISQGDWYINELANQQRLGAHAAGIKTVILYAWLEPIATGGPNQGKPISGAQNADWFMECVGRLGGVMKGEAYASDEEDETAGPDADLGAFHDDFYGRLSRPSGLDIITYSRDDYLSRHNIKVAPSRYWCAAPGKVQPNALIWQYGWHGSVPGINGAVDLDYLTGPIDSLRPFQWGWQPDPVSGRPATGQPDLDIATDVPTTIKHVIGKLEANPPDVPTAIADLSQCFAHNYGLLGA